MVREWRNLDIGTYVPLCAGLVNKGKIECVSG